MPTPVSLMASMTWRPLDVPGCSATHRASRSPFSVSFVPLPPSGPLARHVRVKIDNLGLEDLLAAEREELLRQARRALPGVADLLHVATQRRARLELLKDQLRVSDDDRQ